LTGTSSKGKLAPRLAAKVGRYAHARQFKRMRKALRQLRGHAGRIRRDLRRHLQDIPEGALRDRVLEALWRVGRLLEQTPKSKHKIYSLQEPEVDFISKGQKRVRLKHQGQPRHDHRRGIRRRCPQLSRQPL